MATECDHANGFESEIITLLVGPQLRKLIAHRGYLIKVPFFAACLEKGFKEGEEGMIRLPEDDSDAVEKVLEYLYGSIFKYPSRAKFRRFDDDGDEERENHWALLARCYIAADKYCLEDFQNKIMDVVKHATMHRRVYASGIQELSKAGLRTCPMRLFLLREMACEVHTQLYDEESTVEIHQEQSKVLAGAGYDAEDLLLMFLRRMRGETWEYPSGNTNNCDWHIHNRGEKCSENEKEK